MASLPDGQRGAQPADPGTYNDNIELATRSHGGRARVDVAGLSLELDGLSAFARMSRCSSVDELANYKLNYAACT